MKRSPLAVVVALALLAAPALFAGQRRMGPFTPDGPPPDTAAGPEPQLLREAPPPPPLAAVGTAERQQAVVRVARQHLGPFTSPGSPDRTVVALPLSAGLSMVSIPVRTDSQRISDLFQGLPSGSRVWTWDAAAQRFVEGLDGELALGHGCWVYLPVPAILTVEGTTNHSTAIPVDLERGWNLVGVPYNLPLFRSKQLVYVHHAKVSLDEAIGAGAIGSSIFSLDVSGYSQLGDFFQPLDAYWIWSEEPQLLQLVPAAGLGGPGAGGSLWGTALSWAGQGLLSQGVGFGVSTLLFKMGLGNDASIVEELGKISAKLDTVINNQAVIEGQLRDLLQAVTLSEQAVLEGIKDTVLIEPVKGRLDTHYDQINPEISFAWFAKMAKNGKGTCVAGGPTDCVTDAMRNKFANDVIYTWGFPDDFNTIHNAIISSQGPGFGILDNFANQAFGPQAKGTLSDRYRALESYFTRLVGYQIKCGTLIANAYVQKKGDSSEALDWKTNTFDPVIREEVEYFRDLVERIAVANLTLPVTVWDSPVAVSNELQAEGGMLWSLDYLTMNMLHGPDGLRVRVITSPDIDAPALTWNQGANTQALPPLGDWTTLPGNEGLTTVRVWKYPLYDSWSYGGTWPNGNRQFKFTRDWKMTSTILAVGAGNYDINVTAGPGGFHWWNDVGSGPVKVGLYDVDGDDAVVKPPDVPTPNQAFGSVTIARRPDANYMLNPCLDQHVETRAKTNGAVTNPSASGAYPSPCDQLFIHSNYASGMAYVRIGVPFIYTGDFAEKGSVFLNYSFRDDCGDSQGWWLEVMNVRLDGCSGCPTGGRGDAWLYEGRWWKGWGPYWWTNANISTYSLCYIGLTYKHALICPYDTGDQGCTQR